MFGIIHFGDIFISTRHLVFASVRAHPANECSLLANVYLYGCKLITVAIRLYPQPVSYTHLGNIQFNVKNSCFEKTLGS